MPAYPGRVIQLGESDGTIVRALQERLVARGCGPLAVSGSFDTATRRAVRLFQTRFPDTTGAPLLVDGKVGPLTWATLFGDEAVPAASAPVGALPEKVLKVAAGELD